MCSRPVIWGFATWACKLRALLKEGLAVSCRVRAGGQHGLGLTSSQPAHPTGEVAQRCAHPQLRSAVLGVEP